MKTAIGAYLAQEDLESELARRQGLIPVNIDVADSRISWVDLEQYHCYHGFFHEALNSWAAMRGSDPDTFTSSLDVLDSLRIPFNSLAPTALIFHAGRCGSSLLAQVLARSRENMVFAEAPAHNQIWRRATAEALAGESFCRTGVDATTYRNLFLIMGRRRLPSYRSHIVKFTSFNILKFHQIRAAFPGVPALFLFREPAAVLDSYYHSNPSWMRLEAGIGHTLATPEGALEEFFRAALSIHDPHFRCLDYARLTPESLKSILALFDLDPSPREFNLISAGFAWDAKSGSTPRLFAPRSGRPLSGGTAVAVPEVLTDLYRQLTMWKPL